MHNIFIIFVYLFINLYFPISPILCTGLDIIFAVFISNNSVQNYSFKKYTKYAFACLVIATFSYLFSLSPENQVIFKYVRTLVSTIVVIKVAKNISIDTSKFVNLISVLLLMHVLMIGAQVLYPPLSEMIAPYFNFTRDIDMIQEMQLRKMGLSGGYDSASMLVVTAVILFYYQFFYKGKWIYLALSLLSMAMTLFVSRTGMLIALGANAYFAIRSLKQRGRVRIAGITLVAIGFFAFAYILIPILAATNGLMFDISTSANTDVSYFTQDYREGNGSLYNLTGAHLAYLKDLSLREWVFGAGNSSKSDIGYVQMIFQVGLIGLILIVSMHISMIRQLFKMKSNDSSFNTLKTFLIVYILALFFFNYKILLLYSRGFYDFLILCYVYLVNYYYKHKSILYE